MQHHNHTNSHQTRRGLNRGTVAALLSTLGFFCAITFFGIAQAMIPATAPVANLDVTDPLPVLAIVDNSANEPSAETAEPEAESAPTEEPEVTAPRTNRNPRRVNTGRTVTTPTTTDDSNERNPSRLIINLDDDPMADVDTGGILDA